VERDGRGVYKGMLCFLWLFCGFGFWGVVTWCCLFEDAITILFAASA